MSKKQEFGKGLKALISNIDKPNAKRPISRRTVTSQESSFARMLKLSLIEANPTQPRKEFDDTELQELASSIKTHGLIQPITVRQISKTLFQIISGERRFRASQLAGLEEVPVFIREANDQELVEMALIENIQRSDLNPMEIAFCYDRLLTEFELTHDTLAQRVGKERSSISNFLRLIKLAPVVQQAIKDDVISLGHAKILAGVKDADEQIFLYESTRNDGLSVRALEQLVKSQKQLNKVDQDKPSAKKDPHILKVEDNLSNQLGSRVFIKISNDKGQIQIPFSSIQHLNDVLEQIGYNE